MAYCKNCGQQLPDNANACPSCGAFVNDQGAYQQQNTPVTPVVTGDQDIQQNRGIAWLSYVGILFLIPMFIRKESPYCQFHVKQGATLFALEVAYNVVVNIILLLLPYQIYGVFSTIFNLVNIFVLVVSIIGIVNAATGKQNPLPLVGQIPWIAELLDKYYNKQA